MANLNKVFLIGNLTRDPQVRFTPGGTAVAELGLAVNRTWFDKAANQKKEECTFCDIVVWGKDAERCGEYLAKGRSIFVEGRLELQSWDDKQTGQKKSKMRIVAEVIQYLDKKPGGGSRQQKDEPQPAEEEIW